MWIGYMYVIVGFMAVRLLQWGKPFRLDELPEFNRSVLEVTHSCACVM